MSKSSNHTAWSPLTCAVLGLWLLGSPAGLGHQGAPMAWNDYACGTIALVLGVVAVRSRGVPGAIATWLLCGLGVWLLHAPLVFWTPSAAAYLNATVVGILLIAFSVVLPRQLWRTTGGGPDIPSGWTFNPSSWAQRTPIIALAWINFLLARHLAAYQLDHIPWPWDPFFGDGTQRVLDSDISKAFPISDAGLGAAAYIIEALIGSMGATDRWRSAPWTVALFGVLVIPVGVVSTVLMILQPVAVGSWCTICLVTALLMIVMACLALPEVVAMLQFLARSRRAGRSVWHTFWFGGDEVDGSTERSPVGFTAPPLVLFRAMVCGTTMPWTLIGCTLVGVWFVAASEVLGIDDRAMTAHVTAGALVIVTSILAMSEVLRSVRYANIAFGSILASLIWFVDGAPLVAQFGAVCAALALALLSVPRGAIRQRYGTWDRLVR